MAFKVNYNQQRAERDRAKAARKVEKQKERDEEVARRKAGLPPLGEAHTDSVAESVELNEGGIDGTPKA
jgi:hypothetical protein